MVQRIGPKLMLYFKSQYDSFIKNIGAYPLIIEFPWANQQAVINTKDQFDCLISTLESKILE